MAALEDSIYALYTQHLDDCPRFDRIEPFYETLLEEVREQVRKNTEEAVEERAKDVIRNVKEKQRADARQTLTQYWETGQLPILKACPGMLAIWRNDVDTGKGYYEYVKLSRCTPADLIRFKREDHREIEANARSQKRAGEGAGQLAEALDSGNYADVEALLRDLGD